MSHQVPTTQDTKPGTSETSTKKAETKKAKGPTQEQLNQFLAHAAATAQHDVSKLQTIEAPREIIEYYNPGDKMRGFDEVGYFIFQNVRVCEVGKLDKVLAQDGMSIEQKLFGNRP